MSSQSPRRQDRKKTWRQPEERRVWNNSHLLTGDLEEDVATLKADGDGNVVVLGSGELVQQLIVDDLIDEYRLFLHPLVLGNLEFRAVVANA